MVKLATPECKTLVKAMLWYNTISSLAHCLQRRPGRRYFIATDVNVSSNVSLRYMYYSVFAWACSCVFHSFGSLLIDTLTTYSNLALASIFVCALFGQLQWKGMDDNVCGCYTAVVDVHVLVYNTHAVHQKGGKYEVARYSTMLNRPKENTVMPPSTLSVVGSICRAPIGIVSTTCIQELDKSTCVL